MTIVQAAREVLSKNERSMSIDEIYTSILDLGLFEFHAAHPKGVLRKQLRRYCYGVKNDVPLEKKIFVLEGNGKFSLASPADAIERNPTR